MKAEFGDYAMRKRENIKRKEKFTLFLAVGAIVAFTLLHSSGVEANVCVNNSTSTSVFVAGDYNLVNTTVNIDSNLAIDFESAVFGREDIGLVPVDYYSIMVDYLGWSTIRDSTGGGGMDSYIERVDTFGWIYKEDADATKVGATNQPDILALAAAGKVHYLFRRMADRQEGADSNGDGVPDGDGIPDIIYDTEADYDSDGVTTDILWDGTLALPVALTEAMLDGWGFVTNGDGAVDNLDIKRRIGPFREGTEIIFFINRNSTGLSQDNYFTDAMYNNPIQVWNPVGDSIFQQAAPGVTIELPQATPYAERSCAGNSANCVGGTYNIGPSPDLFVGDGWLYSYQLGRLGAHGVALDRTHSNTYIQNTMFNHFLLGGDNDNTDKQVLGVINQINAYYEPTGFNNDVFVIERVTSGSATLINSASSTIGVDMSISTVTFKVTDSMPCAGDSRVEYFFSIDDGATWAPITNWGIVKTPNAAMGTDVANWHYGVSDVNGDGSSVATVTETYRVATIDTLGMGLAGRNLKWKAKMYSSSTLCEPEVTSIEADFTAAGNGEFARSAPTVLANVIYSGNFESPADIWSQQEYRGHFTSKLVYNPIEVTFDGATENWNGADWMKVNLGARNVVTPQLDPFSVTDEDTGHVGDGSLVTFSGALLKSPVQPGSVSITDGVESFRDSGQGVLTGDRGGFGAIVRFSSDPGSLNGSYWVTFGAPPPIGAVITADYTYTNDISGGNEVMTSFDPGFGSNTTADYHLDDDHYYYYDTATWAEAIAYMDDVDGDGVGPSNDFVIAGGNAPADFEVLIDWVVGYDWSSGSQQSKEWILGAIDHSTPAVVGTPGPSLWYFGLSTTIDEQDTFDMYRCSQYDRNTVTYVGDMKGQTHAFDSGSFRPYYIDPTVYTSGFDDMSCAADFDKFKNAINATNKNSAGYPVHPSWVNSVGAAPLISRGYYDDGSTPLGATGTTSQYGNGKEIFSYIPSNHPAQLKNNFFGRPDQAWSDASPSVGHIQTAASRTSISSWKTILVGPQGYGGSQIFALDITDEKSGTPDLLWEFSDPSILGIEHAPSLGAIGRWTGGTSGATWVVLAAAGSNMSDSANPYVFMIDAEQGNLLRKFELSASPGSNPSGRPVMVDSDYNGYADRIYIGTEDGILYKITVNDDPLVASSSASVCAFYSVPQSPNVQGIYASPVASVLSGVDTSGEYAPEVVILFGTSDDPKLQEDTQNPQYNFYAITDAEDDGLCSPGAGTEKWVLPLTPGHRVFAAGASSAGNVYFGTSTADTEDPCAISTLSDGSVGSVFAVNIETGVTSAQEIANVGNITVTTVVDDEHLYVRDGSGNITGFGGNTYQNDLKRGGQGNAHPSAWRELIQ